MSFVDVVSVVSVFARFLARLFRRGVVNVVEVVDVLHVLHTPLQSRVVDGVEVCTFSRIFTRLRGAVRGGLICSAL